jgi:hypothetical protein
MHDFPVQAQPSDRLVIQVQDARRGVGSSHNSNTVVAGCFCFSDED